MERVSAEDVPDYYEIVTNPMDLNTVIPSPCSTRAPRVLTLTYSYLDSCDLRWRCSTRPCLGF